MTDSEEDHRRHRELHAPETVDVGDPPLIEGVHFYREGRFMVMTALAHLQRGYCCGSGCRHCPYGDVARPAPIERFK